MERRQRLKLAIFGTLALMAWSRQSCGQARAAAEESPRHRPNIILILADDLGFSDLGCFGSEIATPNVDRLAAGGIRFTQFYNSARCSPTRASLLTGLYPRQAGVGAMNPGYDGNPGQHGELSLRCVTIAEVLRTAGYETAMVGKWDSTRDMRSKDNWPLQRGFGQFFGTLAGAGSYFSPSGLTAGNTPIAPEGEEFYYTDAISSRAVQFISECGPKKSPFFLYVSYTAPHWPLHALPQDIAKYANHYSNGWDRVRLERHHRMIQMGILPRDTAMSPRDTRVPEWESAENRQWQASRMAAYAAQVDCMDQGIGRIVESIQRIGAAEDTMILFLSDNGACSEEMDILRIQVPTTTRDGRLVQPGNRPAARPGSEETYQSYGKPWANVSNTPFRLYKHWVHEGGIVTPLIAHWPAGIRRPGSLTDQPGHVIDIMATCLEVSGVAYPKKYQGRTLTPLEGKSLLAILDGQERQGHDAIFWEHEGNRAVRQGRWKLVSRHPVPWYHGRVPEEEPGSGHWELYDLEADRTEMVDLVEKYPEKVRNLAALYDQWARRSYVMPWDDVRAIDRQ